MKEVLLKRVSNFNFDSIFVKDLLTGKEYTYNEFFSRVISLTKQIEEERLPSHIVCIMENSINMMAYFFAIILSGRIATAIDPLKGKDEIEGILEGIPNKYVLVDAIAKNKVSVYQKEMLVDFSIR